MEAIRLYTSAELSVELGISPAAIRMSADEGNISRIECEWAKKDIKTKAHFFLHPRYILVDRDSLKNLVKGIN